MSSRSSRIAEKLRDERRKEITKNQMIALQQMKELMDSPFKVRFKFCVKLLFRK